MSITAVSVSQATMAENQESIEGITCAAWAMSIIIKITRSQVHL